MKKPLLPLTTMDLSAERDVVTALYQYRQPPHSPVLYHQTDTGLYPVGDWDEAATAVEIDREVKRILDNAYNQAKEIITSHKPSLDRIARKLLERETLEGWEVNDILREETGNDYIKMKEYYPEEASPGEKMTIAPGSGPSTDVPTPMPPQPVPNPQRES